MCIRDRAGTGRDRINNIEQVVINSPTAGNYDFKVLGNLIAQNPSQEYFLAYDIIPASLLLTCLLYTSPSPRDRTRSRMPSSA